MHLCLLNRKFLVSLVAVVFVLVGEALAASPEINRFEANPVNTFAPGTELVFYLEGTPQATATVMISGLKQPITLRETGLGWYEGSYTLRTNDRIPGNPAIRATLRQGSRAANAALAYPLVTEARVPARGPATEARAPARGPAIERFTMDPERIEPGMELVFTLEGTPNANATFSIKNVARGMAMTETRPGVYEGRYTVRRQDNFAANDVTAALEANGQVERARVTAAASGQPRYGQERHGQAGFPLEVTSPHNMAEVRGGSIEVRGRSAPNLPLTVQVEATTSVGGLIGLNQNIMSRTVTTDDRGNFTFSFEPRLTVPGTHYEVNISGTMGGQEKKQKLTLVQR